MFYVIHIPKYMSGDWGIQILVKVSGYKHPVIQSKSSITVSPALFTVQETILPKYGNFVTDTSYHFPVPR